MTTFVLLWVDAQVRNKCKRKIKLVRTFLRIKLIYILFGLVGKWLLKWCIYLLKSEGVLLLLLFFILIKFCCFFIIIIAKMIKEFLCMTAVCLLRTWTRHFWQLQTILWCCVLLKASINSLFYRGMYHTVSLHASTRFVENFQFLISFLSCRDAM